MLGGSDAWTRLRLCKDNHGLVTRIVATICWNVWRERNDRIFNNTSHTVNDCVFRAYTDAFILDKFALDR